MNSRGMITVPEKIKIKKVDTEVSSNDVAEYTSSAEWHYPSNSVELIGRSVVRDVIEISQDNDKGVVIDVVPGITRKEPAAASEGDIKPRRDLRTIPGTDAYAQRQQEIADMAHSEWAASVSHNRK